MSSPEASLAADNPEGTMHASLQPYIELIRSFIERRITADEFETRYLAMFKAETAHFDEDTFDTLDGLFADVDAYVADPALHDSPEDLDDEQLRARAACALDKLTLVDG
ncbi:colicin immunity domain-containing protein [Saccharopolyspora thermophila]|nr:colicin immunity domain-containing protein [Saccharopolyspora subtropica]